MGLRSFIPVPCSREIFSSSVIAFTTMLARSSGERPVFIHGCSTTFALVCAKQMEPTHTTARSPNKSALLERFEDEGIFLIPLNKVQNRFYSIAQRYWGYSKWS